jgi:quercetin dioxygenase-like cupin family protein
MSTARLWKGMPVGAAMVVVISAGIVWATPPSGTTSVLIGRATFNEAFHIRRDGPDGWDVKVKATPALDVAVQRIVFQPGAQSGWHSHPGPVFISVVEGTMTFYESDDPTCAPVVRHAGEGFIDVGDHAHIARNETSEPATNVVTYLVPPGAAVRIDEPNPGNCPF